MNRVVLCNGCFDGGLHEGHREFLRQAASFGQLIVGLNSDESVRKLKGDDRPLYPWYFRKEDILAVVPDAAVVYLFTSADSFVSSYKPNLIVRGWDQVISDVDRTYPVLILPRFGNVSTTSLVSSPAEANPSYE
jgi:cytidyltransferase-like protein